MRYLALLAALLLCLSCVPRGLPVEPRTQPTPEREAIWRDIMGELR